MRRRARSRRLVEERKTKISFETSVRFQTSHLWKRDHVETIPIAERSILDLFAYPSMAGTIIDSILVTSSAILLKGSLKPH
jgi:hypothetical protein